ncbi:ArsO family NAD(P)H-dependent flavin-containing monooxygenase [Ornithinimicrobium sp. W1665]|uniref:ArsO family NAD(P)H-dependent flavin-containing monooxygenase n=1 Tax=Ornithinimicrobium sp. W1665 TaxID=3416666 RepID=UPI003CE8E737
MTTTTSTTTTRSTTTRSVPVVVVGGGQAGLATSYYLRRSGLEHVVLDDQDRPGGAWLHTWPSLRLFSPAAFSSLPGWQMPGSGDQYPPAEHVVDYLTRYEERYEVPVRRGVRVRSVLPVDGGHRVLTDRGGWEAATVVSTTGTWSRPFLPTLPGLEVFGGEQLHSAQYRGPDRFAGRRVLVVGGGNSGAQVAADLLDHADVTWCTRTPPRYLPDDVDGRELFRVASLRVRGLGEGVGGLGDVVAVPPVRRARDAGLLTAVPLMERLTPDGARWPDGSTCPFDAVVWCTGFRPALGHLRGAGLGWRGGRPVTDGPTAASVPGLQLVGYGDWCGAASATLVGVGQWARLAVSRITAPSPAGR